MLDIEQARKICTESKIVKLCNNNGELTFSGHLFMEKALTGWLAALDEIERLQKENEKFQSDAEKWQVLITQAGRAGLSEDDLFKMTL